MEGSALLDCCPPPPARCASQEGTVECPIGWPTRSSNPSKERPRRLSHMSHPWNVERGSTRLCRLSGLLVGSTLCASCIMGLWGWQVNAGQTMYDCVDANDDAAQCQGFEFSPIQILVGRPRAGSIAMRSGQDQCFLGFTNWDLISLSIVVGRSNSRTSALLPESRSTTVLSARGSLDETFPFLNRR